MLNQWLLAYGPDTRERVEQKAKVAVDRSHIKKERQFRRVRTLFKDLKRPSNAVCQLSYLLGEI